MRKVWFDMDRVSPDEVFTILEFCDLCLINRPKFGRLRPRLETFGLAGYNGKLIDKKKAVQWLLLHGRSNRIDESVIEQVLKRYRDLLK